MGRRHPRPVSDAVSAALEGVAPQTLLASVQSVWPTAVGDGIAAQTSPVAEREGVVTVACASATWAQELELLKPDLERKIGSELPQDSLFTGLRFTATGTVSET